MNQEAAIDERLIFSWPQRRSTSLALPGFILLSLALHGLSFYLFQVVYPTIVTLPPAPAALSVLNEAIPAHRELIGWVESEDPALLSGFIEKARPGQAALLPLAYQPSFSKAVPEFEDLPGRPAKEPLPSAFRFPDRVAVSKGRETVVHAGSIPPVLLIGEKEFTNRLPPELPVFNVPPSSRPTLEPMRFIVSVTPEGLVEQVFLDKGSGDPEWNLAVTKFLSSLRVAPLAGEPHWEIVLFQWTKGVE